MGKHPAAQTYKCVLVLLMFKKNLIKYFFIFLYSAQTLNFFKINCDMKLPGVSSEYLAINHTIYIYN